MYQTPKFARKFAEPVPERMICAVPGNTRDVIVDSEMKNLVRLRRQWLCLWIERWSGADEVAVSGDLGAVEMPRLSLGSFTINPDKTRLLP